MQMLERNGYPAGVPCWVDIIQADLDSTIAFYRGLFNWTFEVRTPEGAPLRYAYAFLDGLLVAGVGARLTADADPSGWTTYVWVESADETAAAVGANGGRVVSPPVDIPHSGRAALCADPSGAVFGLWQADGNSGAQLVNVPGTWNFSELLAAEPGAAERFYGAVFGWVSDPLEIGAGQKTSVWRVPGYGDFLAERDPEIRERQEAAQAPDGFADAVALMSARTVDGSAERAAGWHVTFAVSDADAAFARATQCGASVVTPLFDTEYTRMGAIKDPQGAILTLSQYRPPNPG
jgi:predicted enzyme related to lactoylglutathione lyase